MLAVRNKFDSLQEIFERHSMNDEFENFIFALGEDAAECIPAKPRATCRVPW